MPAVPASTGRDSPAPLSGYFQTPGRLSPKLCAQKSFFPVSTQGRSFPASFRSLCPTQCATPHPCIHSDRAVQYVRTPMRTYCQSFPVSTYRKQEHADTFLSSACPGERTPRNCSGACPFPSYFSLQRHRRYGDRIRVSAGSGTLSCRGKRPPAEEINLLTGSTPFCCAAAERKRTTPGSSPLHVLLPRADP